MRFIQRVAALATKLLILVTFAACGNLQALKSEEILKAENTKRFNENMETLNDNLSSMSVDPSAIQKAINSVGEKVKLDQSANEKILNVIDQAKSSSIKSMVNDIDVVVDQHGNDQKVINNLKEVLSKSYDHIKSMPVNERIELYKELEVLLAEVRQKPNYDQILNEATREFRNASLLSETGVQRTKFCLFGEDEYKKYSNELSAPYSFAITFAEVFSKICD